MKSFDEFLEKRSESRRKGYYLMAIHEHFRKSLRVHLKQVGWSKATELAKVARRDGQHFDCATWLHRAHNYQKKNLSGKSKAPHRQRNRAVRNALFQSLQKSTGGDRAGA